MGVGDYVHSKEAGQLRPPTRDAQIRSRQNLAEQARVKVPPTKLVAPLPLPPSRPAQLEENGEELLFAENPDIARENPQRRDMFDTDVEGIDDSTIAATSVMGAEDVPYPVTTSMNAQQPHTETVQFEQARRSYDPKWYDNLGEKAFKTAGFDSSDFDDTSQLTSMAGDDEASEDLNVSDLHAKARGSEEPLSKRLQNFWNASRKPSGRKAASSAHEEPSKIPTYKRSSLSDAKALPISGPRKVTLPHSMSATPRTRFSPPKPSLLDKYDLTPTRRSSGSRAPYNKSDAVVADPQDSGDEGGLFANDYRTDHMAALSAFDMTHFDDLDDDPINDPFARRDSVRRISPERSPSKKRQLEADYPPEVLYQKSFADLQAEPFDRTPAATATSNLAQEIPGSDRISHILPLSEEDRRAYFSNLSVEEWEECGDQIIEQFSNLLTKMKDLRQARRKTAAVFEAEIKRRHESVQEQSSEVSKKLEDMRTGGAEVLRGRASS
ncbi:extracellular mutant protein 11-domain-containing protein [Aspergillus ambiguus]|uniref:uncharacterized protein n=1 Tax=Aspergillus ambiguus TaxID=176160 RepID=UPI003CCD954A